jgi:hydrogenase expression/formation protein HypE
MCAAIPLFLSAGFILEEGFAMEDLERIIQSMARAAAMAGVAIVTGDTKVVPRGAADKIFINTAGVGKVVYPSPVNVSSIKPGDVLIVNGTIGDHGAAILSIREGLKFGSSLVSDSAPLNGLVKEILDASPHIHCLRDATRGGLGGIMVEIAKQAGLQLNIEEQDVPLKEGVRGICEVLGFDPLFLANEGKMLTICGVEDAEAVLDVMRKHEFGKEAAIIGNVSKNDRGRCIINTIIGSSREIDLPTGELVPRIC